MIGAFAEPVVSSEFESLRRSANYQQAVYRGAQNTAAWINKPCQGAKASLGGIGLLNPPVFDSKGIARSETWIEHVTVSGCGSDRIFNVVVSARGEGQLGVTPMLAGTSRADPTLQKDAAIYAFTAAKIGPNPCKPTYIADTAFVEFSDEPPLVPGKKSWLERWTIMTCEKRKSVQLSFTPDPTGTTITSRLQ